MVPKEHNLGPPALRFCIGLSVNLMVMKQLKLILPVRSGVAIDCSNYVVIL